jgi:hypothetical protein
VFCTRYASEVSVFLEETPSLFLFEDLNNYYNIYILGSFFTFLILHFIILSLFFSKHVIMTSSLCIFKYYCSIIIVMLFRLISYFCIIIIIIFFVLCSNILFCTSFLHVFMKF